MGWMWGRQKTRGLICRVRAATTICKTRANGEITTRELLVYNITARIVDIRPNGNLVLEARKTMRVDDELVENSLTGTVRAEDIPPNNVVLSEKLAELTTTGARSAMCAIRTKEAG